MKVPYKEQMIAIDKRWADMEYWKAIGVMVDPTTAGYYLNAVDLKYDVNKEVVQTERKIEEFIMPHGLKHLR